MSLQSCINSSGSYINMCVHVMELRMGPEHMGFYGTTLTYI